MSYHPCEIREGASAGIRLQSLMQILNKTPNPWQSGWTPALIELVSPSCGGLGRYDVRWGWGGPRERFTGITWGEGGQCHGLMTSSC